MINVNISGENPLPKTNARLKGIKTKRRFFYTVEGRDGNGNLMHSTSATTIGDITIKSREMQEHLAQIMLQHPDLRLDFHIKILNDEPE